MNSSVGVICLVLCISQVFSLRLPREAAEEETAALEAYEYKVMALNKVLSFALLDALRDQALGIAVKPGLVKRIQFMTTRISEMGGTLDEDNKTLLEAVADGPVSEEASS